MLPELNLKTKFYYEFVHLNATDIEEFLSVSGVNELMHENICCNSLSLHYACGNQSTERHAKLVTEASSSAMKFEGKYEMIPSHPGNME